MRSGVLLGALLIGRASGAQATAQLDVEAASVRATGFTGATGVSVSPSARYDIPFLTLAGHGALAVYGTERYTGQLAAQANAHATWRRLTMETGLSATRLAFRQEAEPVATFMATAAVAPVARAQSELEAHGGAELALDAWSVWGTAGHRTLRNGPTRASWSAEAGVQRVFERVATSISARSSQFRTVSTSNTYVPGNVQSWYSNAFESSYAAASHRWQHDLSSSTTVLAGRAELTAEVGLRVRNWIARENWASMSANWRLDERLTVIGSLGSYPSDRVRALPAARFATLGLRIQRGRSPFEDWFRTPDLPAFRIDTLGGGGRAVRIRAPRALRMELMGDFTDWTALPMRAGDHGEWEIVLPIAPGTYRVSVRADGGRWRAPPGLVPVLDEFGSESAVIVVR